MDIGNCLSYYYDHLLWHVSVYLEPLTVPFYNTMFKKKSTKSLTAKELIGMKVNFAYTQLPYSENQLLAEQKIDEIPTVESSNSEFRQKQQHHKEPSTIKTLTQEDRVDRLNPVHNDWYTSHQAAVEEMMSMTQKMGLPKDMPMPFAAAKDKDEA